MYDLIGDIHGHAAELERLLAMLGYQLDGECYRHKNRKVIFLGDFIDRGPQQRRVLEIVKPMVETGAALTVMGNHEFNAIAYFTEDGDGGYLRPRSEKNTRQHQKFLDAFSEESEAWVDTINWFKSLPLWLELSGLRVVHACWDRPSIARISSNYRGDTHLTDELLYDASQPGTWQYKAVETLLKGKEIKLPNGAYFRDKDGNRRHEIRTRWWSKGNTYRDIYMGPQSAIKHVPDEAVTHGQMTEYGSHEDPVFLGHYWMEGDPTPLAPNIACLDYSVAKPGGKLLAYRWNGERIIDPNAYVSVERV